MQFKHNYVVFGNDSTLMRAAYNDCKKCKQTRYIELLDSKSRILNTIYKYYTSPKINKKFKIPFRSIWNSKSFRNLFDNDMPICFIFFGNDLRRLDNGLIEFLRKKYPGCILVSFCQDLIKTYGDSFKKNRCKFDYIFSFDQGDVNKYNLLYYPLVYSKVDINIFDEKYKSDVYFIGKAKDRLKEILKVYNHLSSFGLDCQFYVTGVEKKDQQNSDKIHYCEGFSYTENLKHVIGANCLLEIMQCGGMGYTIRYAEALTYKKKIITNNPTIKNAPFYNSSFICSYNNVEDINKDFFHQSLFIDEKNRNQISPLLFFEHIDNIISLKNNNSLNCI